MKHGIIKKSVTLILVIVCMLSLVINAYAATSVKSTGQKPAGEYGTLKAECIIIKSWQKYVEFGVETTKKASSNYVITYNIVYSDTGTSIRSLTVYNSYRIAPMRSYEPVDMSELKNARTGKWDGFVNTSITAFSAHEIRDTYAYGIYLATTM